MPPTLAELLPIATEAVDRASRMIRERPPGQITIKGDRDAATEVDFAIEREIRTFLVSVTPEVGFLGEEDGQSGSPDSELTWTLDPVDGTANFIRNVPLCGVSLAVVSKQRPLLGVVDLPFLELRYSAVEGFGAYRWNEKIQVSRAERLSDSLVAIGDYATGAGADARNADRLAITKALAERAHRVRMFGSAAVDLAWVAEGRLSASVMLANKPWDTAAGVILVREAGGQVFDRHGRQHSLTSESTVASAPSVSAEVLAITDLL